MRFPLRCGLRRCRVARPPGLALVYPSPFPAVKTPPIYFGRCVRSGLVEVRFVRRCGGPECGTKRLLSVPVGPRFWLRSLLLAQLPPPGRSVLAPRQTLCAVVRERHAGDLAGM